MAKRHLLGNRLRAASIAALASGMVILCLLGLFFPALRDMVPLPEPSAPPSAPEPSSPPVTPTMSPSMSATALPGPQASAPLGDDGHLDWPDPPNWVDPNPPPAPGDKR